MANMIDVENDVQSLEDYIILNNYENNYSCNKCMDLSNWLHNWLNEVEATNEMDDEQIKKHQNKLMEMLLHHLKKSHDIFNKDDCDYFADDTLGDLTAKIVKDWKEVKQSW